MEFRQAVNLFNEGFSCSQAILTTFAPRFGVSKETALKIACAFGAGMGRMGEVCGAVSGAFMVLGLKYGAIEAQDRDSKEMTYALVKRFTESFQERHGSILCRELLGCSIGTPEGMQYAREKNLFTSRCPRYVQDSAEILLELLG